MRAVLHPFLDNNHWLGIRRKGKTTVKFPKKVIKRTDGNLWRGTNYSTSDFTYSGEPDLTTIRLHSPISINMELTMKCYADCIYCYAKRKLNDKSMLTRGQIIDFIHNAKESGVCNIDINGGDVMLHPYIEDVLTELVKNGFKPLVSTKTILSKDSIDFIDGLRDVRLQISLDSVIPETVHRMINVGLDYIEKMSSSLAYLSKIGLSTDINVVLTKFNSSQNEILSLLDFLSQYSAVSVVRFNPCGCSLYKPDFRSFILPLNELEKALDFIEEIKNLYPMLDINISSYDKDYDFEPNEKGKSFTNRAICTGGTRNAVLLPNGDLTICEELYDHPQFILGNIKRNSLNEIWNSDKAKALYNMSDELNQHSACRNCGDFANCRNNEGVCWKMILMAYGMDNWDYPDPRCPKAPKPFNKFYYE